MLESLSGRGDVFVAKFRHQIMALIRVTSHLFGWRFHDEISITRPVLVTNWEGKSILDQSVTISNLFLYILHMWRFSTYYVSEIFCSVLYVHHSFRNIEMWVKKKCLGIHVNTPIKYFEEDMSWRQCWVGKSNKMLIKVFA